MNDFQLNIVCFDVPFPANYGGVIDVFYRIKALHEIGVRIHLHCFEYGRAIQTELEQLCVEVHVYKRKINVLKQLSSRPYIVQSRDASSLLDKLMSNDYPILFEGLHTCYFLDQPELANRIKAVRMHNIEHRYYAQLAKSEKNWINKNYYKVEANKLKNYQSVLDYASIVFSISDLDNSYFKKQGFRSELLPAFIEDIQSMAVASHKPYAIYHGNLEVPENNKAALYLLEIFNDLSRELIIAGRNPSDELNLEVRKLKNVNIISNPNEEELFDLLVHASIHCLPTFQQTGIKLKLIKSLSMRSHVIANSNMIEGSALSEFCIEANSIKEWQSCINQWFDKPLEESSYQDRLKTIQERHDNLKNAKYLVESLASVH